MGAKKAPAAVKSGKPKDRRGATGAHQEPTAKRSAQTATKAMKVLKVTKAARATHSTQKMNRMRTPFEIAQEEIMDESYYLVDSFLAKLKKEFVFMFKQHLREHHGK